MLIDLAVIDGPNLFNTVGSELEQSFGPSPRIKEYLLGWFDLDRLVAATLDGAADLGLGIVAFHSSKQLGRGSFHLGKETDAFWAKQGSNPNCSTWQVTIPGVQNEKQKGTCAKCSAEVELVVATEKGIDTSITTYLLETSRHWRSVCLFTKDADFVPPVQALRRMGKSVFSSAEESSRISALVRACQSFIPLNLRFVQRDFIAFEILRLGGVLDQALAPLRREEGVDFGIWQSRDNKEINVGIDHDPGQEQRLRGIVDAVLHAHPSALQFFDWDRRNDVLDTLVVTLPPLIATGLERRTATIGDGADWEGDLVEEMAWYRGTRSAKK